MVIQVLFQVRVEIERQFRFCIVDLRLLLYLEQVIFTIGDLLFQVGFLADRLSSLTSLQIFGD
jgi:hypothetical protein